MTIKNKLIFMIALVFSAVSVLPTQVGATPPPLAGAAASVSCYNFTTDFYYGMVVPPARIQVYRSMSSNPAYSTYIAGLTKIHQILEVEGYSIPSTEKNKVFGKATAAAMVKYQTTNKTAIGEDQTGIFSEKTRNAVNQKYGCINKATINLTEPNANSIFARGDVVAIKWDAAKIPNTTDLTIQYVSAQNSSASTTITTVAGVRNGKGQYNWTVPSTVALGQYKILVSLTGAAKSDVSAKAFEVREKSLEITSQTSEVTLVAGNKLPITWKTSTTIKPADKIKVSLVGTLVSDTAIPVSFEIARVANNGSYSWTVPERLNNKIVTGISTFKVVLQTENNSQTSTSTANVKIKSPANVVTGSLTVSQPVANAQYVGGQTIPIKWTSTGLKTTDDLQLSLFTKAGTSAGTQFLGIVKNSGAYNWGIPLVNTLATTTFNNFRIIVSSIANTSLRASSSEFSIVPAAVVTAQITSVSPKSAKPGTIMTVNFKNGRSGGNLILRTLDGTKSHTVPYTVGNAPGMTPYNGSNVTFVIPASIGGVNDSVPVTTGTYNLTVAAFQADGSKPEGNVFPIQISIPAAVVQPKITVSNISSTSVIRGSAINVTWNANTAFPTAAKVTARLMKTTGTTETQVAASTPVAPSVGGAKITVPAGAAVSSASTAKDYKVVLLVNGVVATNPLDVSSDLTTDGFAVVSQGINSTLTAQTNIPTADNGIIYKGTPLSVKVTGTNIPNNTTLTAKFVTSSGLPTTVSTVTPKMNSNAAVATFTLPTTLADGSYKVSVTGTVDGQPLIAETPAFQLANRPVVQPKIVIGSIPASVERGVPFNVVWTSNASVPTAGKVKIELINATTNGFMNVLSSSVAANANSKEVTIPATTPTNGSYKIRLVPVSGIPTIDAASVLESNTFNVSFKSAQITASAFSTVVSRDSSIVIGFGGTAPATTRLSLNLMRADGSSVTGVPAVSALMSAVQAKFTIPASVAPGMYKIGVSGTVDTNLISTTTASFEVKDPFPAFIERPNAAGLISTTATNGLTTSMTASFLIDVVTNGGAFTKPLPANFTIVLENATNGSTISSTSVVVSGSNIAKNSGGSYVVAAKFDTSGLVSSYAGTYRAKIVKMTYTFNGKATTKTDWPSVYTTPAIPLVR